MEVQYDYVQYTSFSVGDSASEYTFYQYQDTVELLETLLHGIMDSALLSLTNVEMSDWHAISTN